jgi:hypothetical protein
MYYIGVCAENPNQLTFYCRNCQYQDETLAEEGSCILNTQFKRGEQKFNHIINKYTKLDPTLPRIYNVVCPNPECATNATSTAAKTPAEVIYMRYDDENMKYLYICVSCDTTWKTNEHT